jgi:hypothetical protein
MNLDEFQQRLLAMRPQDFEKFIFDVIRANKRFTDVARNEVVNGAEIDVRATERGAGFFPVVWIFEAKSRPLVSGDVVLAVAAKLPLLQNAIQAQAKSEQVLFRFVLVVSGSVTQSAKDAASRHGVEIWDATKLGHLCSDATAKRTFGESIVLKGPILSSQPKWRTLSNSLATISAGHEEFGAYQTVVSDIFQHLFCPPLENPRFEFYDEAKRNRRDAIFENAALEGFWAALRGTYAAHYVVVDAKNHGGEIGKDEVLRIAHYLKPYGCGMFGVLVCREPPSSACRHAIKEQWIGSQKMIVVLTNADLIEMLELKGSGGRPEERVRIEIADFRMKL